MSILIATPCYGRMAMTPYLASLDATRRALEAGGVEHDVLLTGNESLVQRARNTMAATFLWGTEFEKLLFIDGDIQFEASDVARLWNADAPVVAGIYPMKKLFAPYAAWIDGKLVDGAALDALEDVARGDFAGTGFLMIDRAVLEAMIEAYPEREHVEGQVGRCFDWFSPRVSAGERPEDRWYMPEDYAFCHDWRATGGELMIDTSVRLVHWGLHGFGSEWAVGRPLDG